MARQNRRDILDPNEVGAYHAVQRTVRRAWLCGLDPVSGKSFEHRRTWIQNRLQELAASFGIDCLSFAVMVNHVHVILRNRPDVVAGWSDEKVAKRWWQLFPLRKNKDKTPAVPIESELKMWMTPVRSKQLRTRLSDISWWMRALAEPIARRSNFEDKCSGRFWEGRYKCQKLADETAILACSAYVDLNPVRAGVADAPEKSLYTSVYERVAALKSEQKEKARAKIRRKRGGRTRSASSGEGQVGYVRRDEWLTPLTLDERSAAYKGAMPSKSVADLGNTLQIMRLIVTSFVCLKCGLIPLIPSQINSYVPYLTYFGTQQEWNDHLTTMKTEIESLDGRLPKPLTNPFFCVLID